MRTSTSALAVAIVVWASAAAAQPWQDAYNRRDYPTAATLLQGMVFEHSAHDGSRYPDVQAIQTLAQMYAEGRGVTRDALLACSLSNYGSGAAVYRHGERDPRTQAIQKQVEAYCVPLTAEQRRDAMAPNGCLQQGPEPRALFVSATRRINLGRSSLTVTDRARTREYPLASLVRCPQQVPMVRYVRVAPPKGSALPAREFIETYSWYTSVRNAQKLRTLEWSAIELTSQAATVRARTLLELGQGSSWPARPVPAQFSRGVAFTMHKSGDIRWQMMGRPSLQGTIGRPIALRAASGAR